MLAASLLAAVGAGMVFLLLPIDGLALGGLLGGFALPGMVSVGSAVTPLGGALLIARVGHKKVIVFGLSLAALSSTLIATGDAVPLRALGAFGCGSGFGLYHLARITYLSDAVALENRGRIVSAVGGMGRIGMFVGPAAGGLIASALGRHAALGCAAGLMALAALVMLALPACATVPSSAAGPHPLAFVTRVLASHRRTFATAGVAMLALALVRSGRMLLIPICGTMLGLTESEVGFIKSASMGADMLLFYPAGLAMDRLGRKWTAVPCLLVLSLGVLLVGHAASAPALLAGAVIAGIGNGLGAGINMTLAGDFSPREGRAEFLGVWALMTELGAVSSPFAMGAVAQALALGAAAALVCAVGVGGAFIMVLAVREPLARAGAKARNFEYDAGSCGRKE
jgi:MFS family permease